MARSSATPKKKTASSSKTKSPRGAKTKTPTKPKVGAAPKLRAKPAPRPKRATAAKGSVTTAKAVAKAVAKGATKRVAKGAKAPRRPTLDRAAVEAHLLRRLTELGTVSLAAPDDEAPPGSLADVRAAAEALAARGDGLLFATASGDALSRTLHALPEAVTATLQATLAQTDALFAHLAPAAKKGALARHVAREEVEAMLAPVLGAFAPEADPRNLDAAPILAAIEELALVGPPDADAVSVPALVLFLTSSGAYRQPREALAAVVFAAGLGHLELLPDGGLGLLADVDADLCPHGPHGTPLRWARRPETTFTAERRPTSLPPSPPPGRSGDGAAGLELERVDAWSAELFEPEEPNGP